MAQDKANSGNPFSAQSVRVDKGSGRLGLDIPSETSLHSAQIGRLAERVEKMERDRGQGEMGEYGGPMGAPEASYRPSNMGALRQFESRQQEPPRTWESLMEQPEGRWMESDERSKDIKGAIREAMSEIMTEASRPYRQPVKRGRPYHSVDPPLRDATEGSAAEPGPWRDGYERDMSSGVVDVQSQGYDGTWKKHKAGVRLPVGPWSDEAAGSMPYQPADKPVGTSPRGLPYTIVHGDTGHQWMESDERSKQEIQRLQAENQRLTSMMVQRSPTKSAPWQEYAPREEPSQARAFMERNEAAQDVFARPEGKPASHRRRDDEDMRNWGPGSEYSVPSIPGARAMGDAARRYEAQIEYNSLLDFVERLGR